MAYVVTVRVFRRVACSRVDRSTGFAGLTIASSPSAGPVALFHRLPGLSTTDPESIGLPGFVEWGSDPQTRQIEWGRPDLASPNSTDRSVSPIFQRLASWCLLPRLWQIGVAFHADQVVLWVTWAMLAASVQISGPCARRENGAP